MAKQKTMIKRKEITIVEVKMRTKIKTQGKKNKGKKNEVHCTSAHLWTHGSAFLHHFRNHGLRYRYRTCDGMLLTSCIRHHSRKKGVETGELILKEPHSKNTRYFF
jgi:hypothetical protein